MLTRGTGENINLAVPLKRIRDNLAKWSMSFILDEAE
jgi:hypothetical protein